MKKFRISYSGEFIGENQDAAISDFLIYLKDCVTNDDVTGFAVEERMKNFDVWSEDSKFSRTEWRSEVAAGNTQLGYWEWVEHCRTSESDCTPDSETQS